ncbi:response regulator transcription factor [Halosimplex salinum]|uniref:response regulator transcription factor n=1 Tax=Halosimplex salinum TaxID=1710538 RepID=UPI0013DE71A5|nr:response regulator [Halosimplex salinum]
MTEGTGERGTVLVVEDEDHLAELYTEYLADEYDVRTAYGGVEAMEMLASDLDVVLLDRRMPIVSGNEVLAEIEERGLQCRVAMVTAVDPDFDIIDMGCDDYVVKPVTRDRLTDVVERLMKLSEYNDRMRDLTSKKLKRNVLQVEKTESELDESDTFQRLQTEIAEMEETIQGIADDLGTDYVAKEQ